MFNYPFLEGLFKKNERFRTFFPRTLKWESQHSFLCGNETRNYSSSATCKTGAAEEENNGALHWKKVVKLKFEAEVKFEEPGRSEYHKDWNIDKILRQRDGDRDEIQCKICERLFETRRELSVHKRLEHFPSWEGGIKGFCYVPYFVEPKRFNLLRGTLSTSHPECPLCHKWLNGRVKEKVGRHLEELRNCFKEKGEKQESQLRVVKAPHKTKRRGRKGRAFRNRSCEVCSKVLSNRKGLERHMLIHTGEKPFPCDVCGKPFRRKDNCVRHKKTAHLFKKPRKPRRRKQIS